MKLIIFLALIFTLVFAMDEIDVGLQNAELVNKTVLCILDKAPCSKFGEKAKLVLSQISVRGTCTSCSKQEQLRAYDIIKRFRELYPELYRRVLAKYRPEGVPDDVPAQLKALIGDHPSKSVKG